MKKVFSVLLMGGLFLAFGCNNLFLPKTELAFCDFILGGGFNECYEKASQNPIYENLSTQKDDLLDYALFSSVEIPFYDHPDITMHVYKGEVRSYKGKIYSVRYESGMVSSIIKMYQAKYGFVKPKKREYEELDIFGGKGATDTFVEITYKWRFENGEIEVVEHYQDDYGSKKDNRASVVYIDKKGFEDVMPLLTERINKQVDSLNQEIENKRLIRESQEREQARIKEEKQEAALKSI